MCEAEFEAEADARQTCPEQQTPRMTRVSGRRTPTNWDQCCPFRQNLRRGVAGHVGVWTGGQVGRWTGRVLRASLADRHCCLSNVKHSSQGPASIT